MLRVPRTWTSSSVYSDGNDIFRNWPTLAREIRGKTCLSENRFITAIKEMGGSDSRESSSNTSFPLILSQLNIPSGYHKHPELDFDGKHVKLSGLGIQTTMVSWGVFARSSKDGGSWSVSMGVGYVACSLHSFCSTGVQLFRRWAERRSRSLFRKKVVEFGGKYTNG